MSKQCYNRLKSGFGLTLTKNCHENTVMSMSIRQLTDQQQLTKFEFAVVVEDGQKISQASVGCAFNLPKENFACTRLLTRQAKASPQQARMMRVKSMTESYTMVEIHFTEIIQKLGVNAESPKILLQQFVSKFIPAMQQNPIQLRAELENLEHIRSCAQEMLKPAANGGLGFNPEFVSQIVCQRLQIAMFGFNAQQVVQVVDVKQIQQISEEKQPIQGQQEIGVIAEQHKILAVQRGQYQPCCMFDFGEQRAEVQLQGDYKASGRSESPTIDEQHTGTTFSFVRGNGIETNTYRMPDGKSTTNLPERFRQFLQFQIQQINGQWGNFDEKTQLVDLPPAMQFLVGLQFGQINVGTWNPFTLAAKKYFALQTDGGVDQFFWKDKAPLVQQTHEDTLVEAFGELMATLGIQQQRPLVAKQFEAGLLAYYAMNMEILSRVDFDGNDRQHCQMQQIYRFEGLEALVPMGIVSEDIIQFDNEDPQLLGTYTTNAEGVPATSKRSVIVSSSATMFATSVDKPAMFPPPIKVITCYQNIHHARVFGTHLFNVDFSDAKRKLPEFMGTQYGEYENGCPFFQDRQREFLFMPVDLKADVLGILAWAPKKDDCCVLSTEDKAVSINFKIKSQFKRENLKIETPRTRQLAFCIGKFAAKQFTEQNYEQQQMDLLDKYQQQLLSVVKQFGFNIFFNVNTK